MINAGRYRWNPGCPHQNVALCACTGLDNLPAIRSRCTTPAAAKGVRDGAIIKRLPGAAEATLRCNQVEGQVNAGGF